MARRIHWHKFFSRGQHHTLTNTLFYRSFAFFPKLLRLPEIRTYRRDSSTYLNRPDYTRILAMIRRQLLDNPSWIERKARLGIMMIAKLELSARTYRKINWHLRSRSTILAACNKLFDDLTRTFVFTYWPIWVQDAGQDLVKQHFQKYLGRNWEKSYETATHSGSLTTVQKLRSLELRLAARLRRHEITPYQLRTIAKRLVEHFGHLRVYFFKMHPYTVADIEHEIRTLTKDQPEGQLRQAREKQRQQKQIMRSIQQQLNPRTWHICRAVAAVTYLREERIALWNKIFLDAHPLFTAAARVFGLPYQEFIQLTYDEFQNKKFARRELRARSRGYRFTVINGKIRITTFQTKPDNKQHQRITVVHGTTAQPGKIHGRVQIADAYTFSELRRGVVLVTAMTTPNAVPHLRRVKAIVTDEGGLTSHAAIISRELKIPCIVGTKSATRLLKTGDRVEVDADKGIVRKL